MKQLLFATALSIAVTSVSYADQTKVDQYLKMIKKHKPELLKAKAQPASESCTNFAGQWQGTCTSVFGSEVSTEDSSKFIEQVDCDSISISETTSEPEDPVTLDAIGELHSGGGASGAWNAGMITVGGWDVDRRELIERSTISVRQVGTSGESFSLTFNKRMFLEGEGLVIEEEGALGRTRCEYRRSSRK